MSARPASPSDRERREDHATDLVIGRLLQAGVAAAAVVLLIGWAAFLALHGGERADVSHFHSAPTSVGAVIEGAVSLRPLALMQLGIVLLVATPVARVALTVVAFMRRRDGIFVLLSGVVLLILLYGLFWSGVTP